MNNLSSSEALKVAKSLLFDRKVSAANLKKAAKLVQIRRAAANRFEKRPSGATLLLREKASTKLISFLETL